MPRYLTPSKVGLLALISVYVDGHVSASATVPVLSFLMSQLLPPSTATKQSTKTVLTTEDFQHALSKLPSDFPGRTVWDLFLKKIWDLDCFESLHTFFDNLHLLLAKTRDQLLQERENGQEQAQHGIRLSRSSPLGVFVRRTQVEFTAFQMEHSIVLWKSFLHFREPTRPLVRKRNPSISKNGFDVNLPSDGTVHNLLYGDLLNEQARIVDTSMHDGVALLGFQLEKIQGRGERLPDQMRQQLKEMIKNAIDLPFRMSYIEFLDSWKGGDYATALEYLHRYFEYERPNKDRTSYQYAVLNLAILHADFGCWSEAISAINETIALAREHKDMQCLNYALSWLFHFGKSNPKAIEDVRKTGVLGTDKEGLAFLKAKAKEANMWGLLSTCYLSEARQLQTSGESVASAFECIAQSSHLNLTKDLKTNIGSELNVQSALFSRLGQNHLAWTCNEVFSVCHSGNSQTDDLLHFTCRSALMEAAKGHYAEALHILESISPQVLRIVKHQQFWTACCLLVKLRQAINKTDYYAAEQYLTQLQVSNVSANYDLAFAVMVYSIELEIRRRRFDKAMELIEKQFKSNKAGEGDVYQTVKMMVLKAQVLAKAGLPQKGFSLTLRAAALAYQARMLGILWEATGALSKVLCSLRDFEAAVQLLKAIMPRVLETEDGELIANSYSYLADAYMGLAGEAKAGSSKRKEQMNKVLECLERAFDEYSRQRHVQGQCEMLQKKATIMHLNGDLVLANDIASKCLGIKKAAQEEAEGLQNSTKT